MRKRTRKLVWGIVNLCRLFVSVVFIFSGVVKIVDPRGSQYKFEDYITAFGWNDWIPSFYPLVFAILLAVFEFILGIYLFFGIRRKSTTVMLWLFMLFVTPFTLYLAITNPVSDCGCFGDAVTLSNWETFAKNVLLFLAATMLLFFPQLMNRFISERNQWTISLYSIVFAVVLAGLCLYRLPVLDFRPYYIGADLLKGMEIPADALPPEYETTFILEKDGVTKEFTLENYPDSTWHFVDSKTVVISEGFVPPIHDFSMLLWPDNVDITQDVLRDTSYTFLLVSPKLEAADDSNIDLINELYDYCAEYGYGFYCLTSSAADAIQRWQDLTGAEYPFCSTDATTLQTVIRSNPGLVLIKDGTVIRKWSHNNLPGDGQLDGPLDRIASGQMPERSVSARVAGIVGWFFIPLLLLTLADRLWAWTRYVRRGAKAPRTAPDRTNTQQNITYLKTEEHEKENRSRQLEDEHEPAGRSGSGKGAERHTES